MPAPATFAIIFLKELKHAFRDKDVIIYTFVVPAVVYPMLLIFGIELFIMKSEADTKERINYAVSAVAPSDLETDRDLRRVDSILARSKRYRKVESADPKADLFAGKIAIILEPVKVHNQDGSDSTRVEGIVARGLFADNTVWDLNTELNAIYKDDLNLAFKEKGLGPAAVQVNQIEQTNLNPQKREMFSMGVALLFFSLFNVALGAAYPAIAATSEEFERNTIEPCLLLPINRTFLMFTKLIAVVSLASLAGSLNLFSMGADSSLALMGSEGVKGTEMLRLSMKMTPDQIPLVVLAYFAITFLYSSILLLSASFCRTVRASQQWISLPLTLFMLVPLAALMPNVELNNVTAFIPLLNNLLVLRTLFGGENANWMHLVSFLQAILIVFIATKVASVLVFERFENKWRF